MLILAPQKRSADDAAQVQNRGIGPGSERRNLNLGLPNDLEAGLKADLESETPHTVIDPEPD